MSSYTEMNQILIDRFGLLASLTNGDLTNEVKPPDIAVIKSENKKLCDLIKDAQKTAAIVGKMPEIPWVCVPALGGVTECSAQFFVKAALLIKSTAQSLARNRCALMKKERDLEALRAAVANCSRRVELGAEHCSGGKCKPKKGKKGKKKLVVTKKCKLTKKKKYSKTMMAQDIDLGYFI